VLCITHLPQVASQAERHFRISKSTSGAAASTDVLELGGEDVVAELVRMLGAAEDDHAASQHARKLLRAA
jgi:DNA repair protein RecN (Recombination protein N)